MTDILKICGVSVGSVRKLYMILPEHVTNLGQKPMIVPITTLPTLLDDNIDPTAKLYEMQFDQNTAYFVERKTIDGRHGDYYTTTLGFQIKGLRPEADYVIELIKNTPVHLLFQDMNGLVKFMTFARLADEANTGDRKSVKNGYVFTFTKRSDRKTNSIPNYLLGDLIGGSVLPGDGLAGIFNLFDADNGDMRELRVYNSGRVVVF